MILLLIILPLVARALGRQYYDAPCRVGFPGVNTKANGTFSLKNHFPISLHTAPCRLLIGSAGIVAIACKLFLSFKYILAAGAGRVQLGAHACALPFGGWESIHVLLRVGEFPWGTFCSKLR